MKDFRTTTTVSRISPLDGRGREEHHEVIIRPLPKAVFLYPTFIAMIGMGVLAKWWPEHTITGSLIFLAIFFINFGVLALDFSRASFFALFTSTGMLLLLGFVVDYDFVEFLPQAISLGRNLSPTANDHLYFALASAMALIYAFVLIFDVRRNYWKVTANGISHHHGFGNSQDYSAQGITLQKDITDVFEYVLLGSGRLMIHPADGPSIVLENVPHINRTYARIETVTEATNVYPVNPFEHGHARRE